MATVNVPIEKKLARGRSRRQESPGFAGPICLQHRAPPEYARFTQTVTSLSRLLQRHGKKEEARQMLADIYGWFTEGFDTAGLKDAKALFKELSA